MHHLVKSVATDLHGNVDAVDDWCATAWQQFLDESMDNQLRVIHVEQEAECCRVRKRAGGILSEERTDSTSFAIDLRLFLQRKMPDAANSKSSLATTILHRNIECNIECHWYRALRGEVLVIRIHHERNIPGSLEQTTLDPDALLDLRLQLYRNKGGMTIISGRSSEVLCDLYYALLNELTPLDQKVMSFESVPRKSVARINHIINAQHYSVPEDASRVFIDWTEAQNIELLNGLLESYHHATIFIQAHSLPTAIRKLTDLANSERQLATNLTTMVEVDRVRLICPHCASAHQIGKFEVRLMKERGINTKSTLNYASGCESCDYTGFGHAKTLIAQYPCDDLLRNKIESRNIDAIENALATSNIVSVQEQQRSLVSEGKIEFKLASNDD